MGFLKRLLGRGEEVTEPSKERKQLAGHAEAVEARRKAPEVPVVRLTPELHEWDVPDDGEEDIWWRGHHLRDGEGIGLAWDDPVLSRAGIIISKVVGTQHYGGLSLEGVGPGRSLRIVAEPDNPYDPNAVAICDEGGREKIGYLPREVAATVSARLRTGERLQAMCIAEFIRRPDEVRAGLRVLLAPTEAVEGWPVA